MGRGGGGGFGERRIDAGQSLGGLSGRECCSAVDDLCTERRVHSVM